MGGSGGGSKASFTPFVDPRVYGTSPTEDDNISASGTFPVRTRQPTTMQEVIITGSSKHRKIHKQKTGRSEVTKTKGSEDSNTNNPNKGDEKQEVTNRGNFLSRKSHKQARK